MSDDITVVLAADAGYAMQLAVTIASLSIAHEGKVCHVFVLHDDFPAELRSRVDFSTHGLIDVEWIAAGKSPVHEIRTDGRLTTATLYRLCVTDLVPGDLIRALYLDCDLVVRHDLCGLWMTPLDDHLLAAVRDAHIPWVGAPGGLPWQDLDLDPHAPYFNAGVLSIALDRWRDEAVGHQVLALMRTRDFHQMDQGGLNAILSKRWKRVGAQWNLQGSHFVERNNLAWAAEPIDELASAYEDPSVVHYSGLIKPWHPRCVHPFRDEWFAALEATAWARWQPPRAIARRTLARAARAGSVLRRG